VYERAMQELDERDHTQDFFTAFAQFEERAKEDERARGVYKYALQVLPKSSSAEIYKKYVQFEKQHGDRRGIEDVVSSKKRFQCVEI
jgi:crooked neck